MASIIQLAGMLPRDPQFLEWCELFIPGDQNVCPDEAAEFIRQVCKVTSRRQLAQDRDAEQRFHRFIRRPFTVWRDQQQAKTHIRVLERNQPLRRAA